MLILLVFQFFWGIFPWSSNYSKNEREVLFVQHMTIINVQIGFSIEEWIPHVNELVLPETSPLKIGGEGVIFVPNTEIRNSAYRRQTGNTIYDTLPFIMNMDLSEIAFSSYNGDPVALVMQVLNPTNSDIGEFSKSMHIQTDLSTDQNAPPSVTPCTILPLFTTLILCLIVMYSGDNNNQHRKKGQEDDLASALTHVPVNRQARILAIDNNLVNLKTIKDILSPEYEVTTIMSGEKALEQLFLVQWDLVIVDTIIHSLSGHEIVKEIRAHFPITELPVLLVTALQKDTYKGVIAGANDYITKPLDPLELKARVYTLTTLTISNREQLNLEASWLQAQIKPHFIFNTLNSIVSLSYFNIEKMRELLSEFGNYLRKSYQIASTTITLDEELDLVFSYLFIEQERFGDRIQVIWDIDESISIDIPPFSMQTIVENSLKHGVLPNAGGGTITIQTMNEREYIKIVVSDDGIGMDEERVQQILQFKSSKDGGIGLINTNKRLLQLNSEGLQIESALGKGTTVTFLIPNI